MVLRNIERIKNALPELVHVVMFYNDGVVFQTTFEPSANIPKVGENLAGILSRMKKLLEICKFETEPYKKLAYETKNYTIIILKLGENSNLALFFQNIKGENINIRPIRKYLNQIERLIDMDTINLEKQELKQKETDFHIYELNIQLKLNQLEKLESEINDFENEINAKKEEIESKKMQITSDNETIEAKKKEMKEIAENIEMKSQKTQVEKEITFLEENIKKSGLEIEQMEINLKKAQDNKEKMYKELKNLKNIFDKSQQDLSEKSKKIEELKGKIDKVEKEKFAEKN